MAGRKLVETGAAQPPRASLGYNAREAERHNRSEHSSPGGSWFSERVSTCRSRGTAKRSRRTDAVEAEKRGPLHACFQVGLNRAWAICGLNLAGICDAAAYHRRCGLYRISCDPAYSQAHRASRYECRQADLRGKFA